MLWIYVSILIIPTLAILGWSKVIDLIQPQSGRLYRLTGIIGTPVHELSHAAVCLLFGMKIVRMKLYVFNPKSSQLGYVDFAYSPDSPLHMVGRLFQAIAPLITGAFLVTWSLGITQHIELPPTDIQSLLAWIPKIASITLYALWSSITSNPFDIFVLVLVCMVAMHAIPSISDMKIGLKGLVLGVVVVSLLMAGLSVLNELIPPVITYFLNSDPAVSSVMNLIHVLLNQVIVWMQTMLSYMLLGTIAVVTLALFLTSIFVIIPATLRKLLKMSRISTAT